MAGRSIAIAGAGIAGLTTALAFAARGNAVTMFERAARIEELGAGIQLSPNATRLLERLGVLDDLRSRSTSPKAIAIRSAKSLASLAEVPLSDAERRWGAPYLVLRRSDLQATLLEAAAKTGLVEIRTGAEIAAVSFAQDAVDLELSDRSRHTASLAVAADGVWSKLRTWIGGPASTFTGDVAYRAILEPGRAAAFRHALLPPHHVSTFVLPGFHLVTYPLADGAFNLVIIARGPALAKRWETLAHNAQISAASRRVNPALADLIAQAGPWHAWPIHEVASPSPWSKGGKLVLIGDAAHALAPHAAQGAAMAVEDAALLARALASTQDTARALRIFEELRRPRLARVALRGRFNHFAWQVGGPAALVRDVVLRLRSGEKLAADFDWLYGHDVEKTPLS
jgi:salicylate hydroxylase